MLGLTDVVQAQLFICLSPAHAEGRADNPRFQVVVGSFAHSKVAAKINRTPTGSVLLRCPAWSVCCLKNPRGGHGVNSEHRDHPLARVHRGAPASVSVSHDLKRDLTGIRAPVLVIHGRYRQMAPFKKS
jgi:pimeloyl-ACP methyl ester carboxylesterase